MSGYRVIGGSLNTCPPLFSSDGRYVWVSNSIVIFCIAVGSSNGGGNNVIGGGCDENPKSKKKGHIHGGRGGLRYESECVAFISNVVLQLVKLNLVLSC